MKLKSSVTSSTSATHAKTNWRLIALLYSAGLLAALQYAKVPYMLPGLAALVPMSPVAQAILLSVIGVMGALAGAFAGAICQAAGLRRSVVFGLGLATAGAALPLLVSAFPVLWLLFVGRLIESVAHMAIVVAVPTLMLSLASQADRARVMALWSCYFTATFIITASVAQPLLALGGWQIFALLHVLLLTGVAALFVFTGSADKRGCGALTQNADGFCATQATPATPAPPAKPVNPLSVPSLVSSQTRLLTSGKLLATPATFFGYTLLFVALVSVLPGLIAQTAQQRFNLAMALPGASLAGTVICMLALGHGVAGHRLVQSAAAVLMVCACSLITLPNLGFAVQSFAVQAVVVVTFVFLGMLPAGAFSSIPALFNNDDPDIALVNGGMVQFGNLGNFLGSPVLAALLLAWGWPSIGFYLLMGALVVSACIIVLKHHVNR